MSVTSIHMRKRERKMKRKWSLKMMLPCKKMKIDSGENGSSMASAPTVDPLADPMRLAPPLL